MAQILSVKFEICNNEIYEDHQLSGQIIETPASRLNEMRITSDPELIVLTPDTGSVVTFTTYAPSAPLTNSLDASLSYVSVLVSYVSVSYVSVSYVRVSLISSLN